MGDIPQEEHSSNNSNGLTIALVMVIAVAAVFGYLFFVNSQESDNEASVEPSATTTENESSETSSMEDFEPAPDLQNGQEDDGGDQQNVIPDSGTDVPNPLEDSYENPFE